MKKGLVGIHKGLEKKKEQSRNKRAEAFVAGCRKLTETYGIDWTAELQFTPNGIKPVLRLADAEQGQIKAWSEAKAENLKTRMNCEKHKIDSTDKKCSRCDLTKEFWGEDGKGATEEYIDREQAAIRHQKELEEKEMAERNTLPEEKE